MKKFLFSTTALAVAGAFAFGADANAAAKPIKIAVGGFMTTEMGFGNNDSAFETGGASSTTTSNKRATFNNVQDSEILFSGSTKLDNGISLSINIQLEGDQAVAAGTQIDESYMKLTGAFGDLRLGSTTGTNSVLKHMAPYVGVGLDGGGSDNYITVPAAVTAGNSSNASTSGDANKIAYITPRSGGLALGVSWTPSTSNLNTSPVTGGNAGTEIAVLEGALSYETTMGTSSVKADIAFESASNNTRKYRGGVLVGAGGVTVGGSYSVQDDDTEGVRDKRIAYDLGVSYVMGAYKFGLAMAQGTRDFGTNNEDDEDKWSAGLQYTIDTGVTGTLTYINADYEDGASGADTNNNDGHALIGQIKVSF
ncbi:porin [Rhodospirillales bacterium]|nr:porin [Rhodospirillales bacterium]